jgi:hypothetical protein
MAIDATVDQVVLPHLMYLTSFQSVVLRVEDIPIVQSIWTSLLVNNVKLSEVVIRGFITKETMLFLLSFSGLKRLAVEYAVQGNLDNMFFAEVLPKHVSSLQTLSGDGVRRATKRCDSCDSAIRELRQLRQLRLTIARSRSRRTGCDHWYIYQEPHLKLSLDCGAFWHNSQLQSGSHVPGLPPNRR